MLRLLARHLSRPRHAAALPAPRPRALAEQMEPRVLYSAELAPAALLADSGLPAAETRLLDDDAQGWLTVDAERDVGAEILFIDSAVEDADTLLTELRASRPMLEVVYLDASRDGIAQISEVLAGRSGLGAVHILSHGASGQLQLGNSTIDGSTLETQGQRIAGWANAFSADGDLLLYGCDVAAGAEGARFVDALAQLTGADVAASSDPTGAAGAGGNWLLEKHTGAIEAPALASLNWQGRLAVGSPSGEISLNTSPTYTNGVQDNVAVAMLKDGNWMAVWESDSASNNKIVVGRVFNAGGTAQSAPFVVNQTLSGNQGSPEIASDGNNFVVTWVTDQSGNQDIYARRFSGAGAPLAGEFLVHAGNTSGNQAFPAVAMSASGSFVVAWSGEGPGDSDGVFAQRFDPVGTAVGSVIAVNTTTGGLQSEPSVAMTDDGRFVVTWMDNSAAKKIVVRTFTAAGVGGSEIDVQPPFSFIAEHPAVAMDGAGNFVVVFDENGGDFAEGGTNSGVRMQRFDAAGTKLGVNTTVNTTVFNAQDRPRIAMNSRGDFVVAWESNQQDGNAEGTYFRSFEAGAVNPGLETQANVWFFGKQEVPDIAMNDAGEIAVVWQGPRSGSLLTEVNGRTYSWPEAEIINSAPVMTPTGPIIVFAQEDAPVPPNGSPVGFLISELVSPVGSGSGPQNVFDANGDSVGIALYSTSESNGTWWYSINSGTNWAPVGGAASNNALLLANNGLTRLYYQPSTLNDFGVAKDSLDFRAWDGATGANGGRSSINPSGGTRAFSNGDDSATLTISAVNDLPAVVQGTPLAVTEGLSSTLGIANLSASDVETPSAALAYTINTVSGGFFALGVAPTVAITAFTQAQINAGSVIFVDDGDEAAPSYTFSISDGTASVGPTSGLISFTNTNDPPSVVPINMGSLAASGGRLITQAELLAGASDPDSGSLTAAALAITSGGGSLVDNLDGTWTYSPGLVGPIAFSFTVSDGIAAPVANTASLTVIDAYSASADIPINTATAGTQDKVAVAILANGNWLAVWQTDAGTQDDIVGRIFDASGAPQSAEFLINQTAPGRQTTPAVSTDGSGSFIVAWVSNQGADDDIYARRFDASGTPSGNEFLVNSGAVAGNQATPAIAMSATGEFVVAWSGSGPGDTSGIFAQRFSAAEVSQGGVLAVNTSTSGTQSTPSVATNASNAFVISWLDQGASDTILARAYDSAGTPGSVIAVQSVRLGTAKEPDVAMDASGNFVVVWDENSVDADRAAIRFQRFDASGVAQGGPVTANVFVSKDQERPRIAMNNAGDFALAWESDSQDGDQETIILRTFEAGGVTPSAEIIVNTYVKDKQQTPDIAINNAGRIVVVWQGERAAGATGAAEVSGKTFLWTEAANTPPSVVAIDLGSILTSGTRLITQASLLAGASDADSDPLTATALAITSGGGSLVDNLDGTWTYTPGAAGAIAFSFSVDDGTDTVANTASLTVNNTPPSVVAINLGSILTSGTRVITQGDLLAGASDADSDPLTATALAITSGGGSLVDNLDGTWTYTPGAAGAIAFSFSVDDGTDTVANTASLTVTLANTPPTVVAVNLGSVLTSGTRLITQADLLAGASDADSDPLTATALAITSGGGSLVDNLDGTWTYTPGAAGAIAFSFSVDDGTDTVANSASLTVTLANTPPSVVAVNLGSILTSGTRVITQADLLAGASDADSDPLTATALAITSGGGSLVDNLDGTWTYTPGAAGAIAFSFSVDDGTDTVANTASLTVNNTPPSVVAINLGSVLTSGTRVITQADLLAGASDADSDPLTATTLAITSGGGSLVDNLDGTWTYTPGAAGAIAFSFSVDDGTDTVANTASLTVTLANTPPSVVAVNLGSILTSGTRLITQADLLAGASDVDSDPLTATALAITSGGGSLVDNLDGTWTYTPGAAGAIAFSFSVDDGTDTVANTASLTVALANTPPSVVAVNLGSVLTSGTRLITQADLLAGASDADSDPLTATALAITSGGGSLVDNLDGTWTYTPGAAGAIAFSFSVDDGTDTVANTASLTVTLANTPPTVVAIDLGSILTSGTRLITQASLLAGASDADSDPLTATALAITSGGGSLVDNLDGTWTYTPGAAGAIAFSFSVDDGTDTVANTASLTVTLANTPPSVVAINLGSVLTSGTRLITQADLLAGASDADSDPLTATALAITSGGGALVDNLDGTWTYTPGAAGAIAFSFSVDDGTDTVANTASLTVTLANTPPSVVAINLGSVLSSNTRLITQADLLAGASDADSDPLTATALAITSGSGALVDNLDGTWTYTPGAAGAIAFSFSVDDGTDTVANSASLTVTLANTPPTVVAVNLGSILTSGTRVITQADLLAGASDADADPLTATALAITSGGGSLVDNLDGTWTYSPGAAGAIAFSFSVDDGTDTVANTASLTVTLANTPPSVVAVNLGSILTSGTRVITQADLLAGASDADSDPLTATALAITSGGGSLVDNLDGTWTYTPGAAGAIAFSFSVDDGTDTVANSASLTVTLANTPPSVVAVNLGSILTSGTRVITQADLLAGASDADSDPLTATALAITSGGGSLVDNLDGTWTYTPGAAGAIAFSFSVDDGTDTVANTASLTVNNTPPSVVAINLGSVLTSGTRVITQADLLAGASDADSDPLTATALAITSGGGGLVDNLDGTWTYTPGAAGAIAFSFSVDDGTDTVANSASLTVTLANTPPTVVPVNLGSVLTSGSRLITQANLLAGASDADSDPLTATALAITSGGGSLVDNLDGTWTYTPGAAGAIAFSFSVDDGTDTVANTASLTVNNTPPSVVAINLGSVLTSGTRVITQANLLAGASDADADPLTATALAITSGGGSLVDNLDGTWTYTPGAAGAIAFSFSVGDGTDTVANTASLTVTLANTPPTVVPVNLGSVLTSGTRLITQGDLLAGASDTDGDALTASGLSLVGGGSLADNGNGTWTYTPGAAGAVAFSFSVSDGTVAVGNSASLGVTAANTPPTVSPVELGSVLTDGSRLITQADLLAGAADTDGDALTASGLSLSGSGSLANNGDGTWTYTPDSAGAVSFSFSVSDGTVAVGNSATLGVVAANRAPTTVPFDLGDVANTASRLITQADLLAGASDEDGDPLTASGLAIASGSGSLVDNGDGSWTYVPGAGSSGAVSFSFAVDDGRIAVANAASLRVDAVEAPALVVGAAEPGVAVAPVVTTPPAAPTSPPTLKPAPEPDAPAPEPSVPPVPPPLQGIPATGLPEYTVTAPPIAGADIVDLADHDAVYLGSFSLRLSDTDLLALIFPPQDLLPQASLETQLSRSLRESRLEQAFAEMRDAADEETRSQRQTAAVATVTGAGLTIGYVAWLIRGGVLLTSLLSSMPAWRLLDPYPILGNMRRDDDDDDDSLESMVDTAAQKKPDAEPASAAAAPGAVAKFTGEAPK